MMISDMNRLSFEKSPHRKFNIMASTNCLGLESN